MRQGTKTQANPLRITHHEVTTHHSPDPEQPMPHPPFTPGWKPRAKTLPRAFREAPPLPHRVDTGPPAPGEILLINPFYRKDPNASFGKHVLTPTLALTSIAGATPPGWNVRYWDE